MENRRAMERFNLNLLSFVRAENEESEFEGPDFMIAANICSDGALLKTDKPLAVNTRVQVDFFLVINGVEPETKKKMSLVEVTGRVIRLENKAVAVKFDKNYRIWPLSIDEK